MSDIKPIETIYKDYRFRSRLEARWAVFFDAMGWKYEYEPEGYDLGHIGWYLPDFWLPILTTRGHIQQIPDNIGVFIEVKGVIPDDRERRKMATLANRARQDIKLFVGTPWDHSYASCSRAASSYLDFIYCPAYWNVSTFPISLIILTMFLGYEGQSENFDKPLDYIVTALKESKQARFEHGEKPEVS